MPRFSSSSQRRILTFPSRVIVIGICDEYFCLPPVVHDRKTDGKGGALAVFTIDFDSAVVCFHHAGHVGQSDAHAFHVVDIAGRHAIEAIEDALQVFLLDADAVVGEGNDKLFSHVFGETMSLPALPDVGI